MQLDPFPESFSWNSFTLYAGAHSAQPSSKRNNEFLVLYGDCKSAPVLNNSASCSE